LVFAVAEPLKLRLYSRDQVLAEMEEKVTEPQFLEPLKFEIISEFHTFARFLYFDARFRENQHDSLYSMCTIPGVDTASEGDSQSSPARPPKKTASKKKCEFMSLPSPSPTQNLSFQTHVFSLLCSESLC
jgi:hypothetical protein